MELRQLDIYLPRKHQGSATELLSEQEILGIWKQDLSDKQVLVRALLSSEYTEGVLDLLEKHFSAVDGYRIVITPVQASLPHVEEVSEPKIIHKDSESAQKTSRINREELYALMRGGTELTRIFFALTILATVVAVIGLLRGDVPVIIGAMVLAPLLEPSMALALGTTLGDTKLIKRATIANAVGLLVVVVIAIIFGIILQAKVSPELTEIASRTTVGIGDIGLALAAGAAGALAITSGVATALIGVVAALALLPPLVVFGMLLGAGYLDAASGALLLTLANIISLNLAAVLVFLAQGVRPAKWWEAYRAEKTIKRAIIFWSLLLLVLMVLAILVQA